MPRASSPGFRSSAPAGPEEIAATVAFLGSSDASYVTGAELPVDGGLAQV